MSQEPVQVINEPGYGQAKQLFGIVQEQFEESGVYVANQAVDLPDCVPKWSFIDELLGPGDGPGSRRLRQALAGSFEKTARQRGMENTLVLATVNVLLTRGMMWSTTRPRRAVALPTSRASPTTTRKPSSS
jgi:hypothetical protein